MGKPINTLERVKIIARISSTCFFDYSEIEERIRRIEVYGFKLTENTTLQEIQIFELGIHISNSNLRITMEERKNLESLDIASAIPLREFANGKPKLKTKTNSFSAKVNKAFKPKLKTYGNK